MNGKLIAKIDECIESSRDELTEKLIRLVNIKSVQGESMHGAPFGDGPKKVPMPYGKWESRKNFTIKITEWVLRALPWKRLGA